MDGRSPSLDQVAPWPAGRTERYTDDDRAYRGPNAAGDGSAGKSLTATPTLAACLGYSYSPSRLRLMHRLTDQTARLISSLSDGYRREGELGRGRWHSSSCCRTSAIRTSFRSATCTTAKASCTATSSPTDIVLEDGPAIVADFGIAHATTSCDEEKLTKTG